MKNLESKLNWFEMFMLKRIAKKAVKQDFDHSKCIEQLYRCVNEAATNEFNQDTEVSLHAHLKEWFGKSLINENK